MGVGDCQMVSGGVSTNHVGERRNFCFAEIRRPISRSCGGLNLYKPCRRIKAGERCSPLQVGGIFGQFLSQKYMQCHCTVQNGGERGKINGRNATGART